MGVHLCALMGRGTTVCQYYCLIHVFLSTVIRLSVSLLHPWRDSTQSDASPAAMLARINAASAHFLDVCFESSGLSTQENDGEHSLVVDLYALRCFLPSTKDDLWGRVAACGRVVPICSNIQQVLSSDFEKVTKLLLDLESKHKQSIDYMLPVGLLNHDDKEQVPVVPRTMQAVVSDNRSLCDKISTAERPLRKRRRSSQMTLPVVIPSTHSSTPSIIITFSPPQSRETSSCIPYQNQAFGNLLPVPSHPVFNKIHPPMSLDSYTVMLPYLDNWQWDNGHWAAILPSLEEQHARGMFSKPISSKRKSCRTPTCSGSKGRRCR